VSLCACAVVVVHVRVYVCASVIAYVFVYFANLTIFFFALCTCGLCIPPFASPILISHAGVPVLMRDLAFVQHILRDVRLQEVICRMHVSFAKRHTRNLARQLEQVCV